MPSRKNKNTRASTVAAAFALVALVGCSGAAPAGLPAMPPTRQLSTSCPRSTYTPKGVTLDVTCDGAPVHTGLRCGELADLPADVECSLQPMHNGAPIGGPFEISAGADPVSVRVVLP